MSLATLGTHAKILGAFSMLLLVIDIISGVAIWRIHTGEVIARDLVEEKLAKQLLTSKLLGATRLNGLRVMSIARSDSLELADLYKEQLAQGEKKAAQMALALAALPMSAGEQALLEAASAGKAGDAAAAAEVMLAKEQGRTQDVEALVARRLDPMFKRHTDSLQALLDSALAGVAGATMTDIVAGVQELSVILAAINAASAEQAQGIEQVGHAITEMDGVTRQNAALVEQAAAAAASMRAQAGSLSALVGTFKVKADAAGRIGMPARPVLTVSAA